MKTIRKNIINLIILVALTIVVAAGCSRNSARTIKVEELEGTANVANTSGSAKAYEGQNLQSGDEVSVLQDSTILLLLDKDKHVFATEGADFIIASDGTDSKTKTIVEQSKGAVVYGIDNKLGDEESFRVKTPNATMSVRGTVFTVEISDGDNPVTVLTVTEGSVTTSTVENGETVTGEVNADETVTFEGDNPDFNGSLQADAGVDNATPASSSSDSDGSSDETGTAGTDSSKAGAGGSGETGADGSSGATDSDNGTAEADSDGGSNTANSPADGTIRAGGVVAKTIAAYKDVISEITGGDSTGMGVYTEFFIFDEPVELADGYIAERLPIKWTSIGEYYNGDEYVGDVYAAQHITIECVIEKNEHDDNDLTDDIFGTDYMVFVKRVIDENDRYASEEDFLARATVGYSERYGNDMLVRKGRIVSFREMYSEQFDEWEARQQSVTWADHIILLDDPIEYDGKQYDKVICNGSIVEKAGGFENLNGHYLYLYGFMSTNTHYIDGDTISGQIEIWGEYPPDYCVQDFIFLD